MSVVLNKEQRIQAALGDIQASGLNSRGYPILSLREAARRYEIPHQTLTARYNGRPTRQVAHQHQQVLTPSQEEALKEWIKSLGYRGIPLSPSDVSHYASVITGQQISDKWTRNFRKRHGDLKARWTTSLERCRAKALNRTQVTNFFQVLKEVVEEFNIIPSNIYNMDEKGVQLGVGVRSLALVDRDQKTVHHIENGDRELVTVIEAVAADGASLPPSVIFKGKRRNLEWGRDNPCNASISVSENGWTDTELGLKWLMHDFEPTSAARNPSHGWRLLILDGHNSHCSYAFVSFCEKHRIALICLPSHTTHRLQPCDVGVFGPLAATWKAAINDLSRNDIQITKLNFLSFYSQARTRAITPDTVLSAFRKTGISPFNPSVIEDTAFIPALNTTTEPAQPVPVVLPPFLKLAQGGDEGGVENEESSKYILANFPSPIKRNARLQDYQRKTNELHQWGTQMKEQIERDFALKKLMEDENGRLRKQLFAKQTKKPQEGRVAEGGARHMTNNENILALAKKDFMNRMKAVFQEASDSFREIKKEIKAYEKEQKEERDRAERAQKAAERAAKRAAKKVADQAAKEERAKVRRAEAEAKKLAVAAAKKARQEEAKKE